MCGIAGIYRSDVTDVVDRGRIQAMCDVLRHRGPDDSGLYVNGRIGLGMTRLSIIDLVTGHQPMFNEDGTLAIVFNGEIYNYRELRRGLEGRGHRFGTDSDTEVILHLYEELGAEMLPRLNGMFAFALWDECRQELFLARDRMGVKPLYYARSDRAFVFASEIKALLRSGEVQGELDPAALDRYLAFLWVPEPSTIFRDVHKLPAAHWMRVAGRGERLQSYWSLEFQAPLGRALPEAEAATEMRRVLEEAVARQTVADVPVGAFLSGGIDSTTVVANMVRSSHPPIRVFSARWAPEDRKYERFPDDARYARAVVRQLGLDSRYQETTLRPDMVTLLPRLVWHLDEPLADPAILPAYLLCEAARPYTKVLLSGMGADEIFAGYRRHLSEYLLGWYSRIPSPLRRRVLEPLLARLPQTGRSPFVRWARHSHKLVENAALDPAYRYIGFCTWVAEADRRAVYSDALATLIPAGRAADRHRSLLDERDDPDPLHRMLALDTLLYLPSHNLNYTDKMSMAASVEVRVPYLDNEVVDLATRLPASFKLRRLTTKRILRRAARGLVPAPVVRRGKTGFGAPMRSWLAGDLHEMTRDLLAESRLRRRGYFDAGGVTKILDDHFRGGRDRAWQIWALLTFELWADTYLDRRPAPSPVAATC